MDFRILINGRDVTEDVSLNNATLDTHTGSFRDNATLVFNDSECRWGDWQLEVGTSVALRDGIYTMMEGYVSSWSLSSGLASVEVKAYPDGKDKERLVYATLDGTVEDSIRLLCSRFGMACSFHGDFSGRVHGMWIDGLTLGKALDRLSCLFDFHYTSIGRRIAFVTTGYLRDGEDSGTIRISQDSSYGYSRGMKFGSVTVTNGRYTGSSSTGKGGPIERSVLEGGYSKSELDRIAEHMLARLNRNDGFSLTLDTGDSVPIAGGVLYVEAPNQPEDGRFLVTDVRISIDKGVCFLKGVRLD